MSRKNYWANTFATPIEDTPEHKERVKGKPYLGFVNKNHSSTIVKGKDFYNAEGSVASLPKKTQASVCKMLDDPKTLNTTKIGIYRNVPSKSSSKK